MNRKYRVAAYVNLGAIRENLCRMQEILPQETGIMAVVKTDAYGHGALRVSAAIEDMVASFAVATADEALELRQAGIRKPILILGYTHDSYYEELIRQEIRPCVYSYAMAEEMAKVGQRLGEPMKIHIKVDTGMGRLGFLCDEQGVREAARTAKLPGIQAEGVFTHFACADEEDKTMTNLQLERYEDFLSGLAQRGVEIPIHHVANSACILELPHEGRQLVRAGLAMYGYYPSEEVGRQLVQLTPALSLKSHIIHLKWLEPGATISYGATYQTSGRRRIATIPVGYGDGYPRSLSDKGWVLIHGQKAPICGRICMDQMMVDVTEIPEAELGDAVILIGWDGEEKITAEQLGQLSGRFHYELLCDLNQRVPRIYETDASQSGLRE